MRRALVTLLLAAGVAGSAAAPAPADPTVTITPPTGPDVRAYPGDLRTTNPQPTFGVSGQGGASLRCALDDSDAFTPCPGGYQPPAPLGGGAHTLTAELDDASGSAVAQTSLDFFVDTTPPNTIGVGADGPALRPTFSFTVDEDDPLAPDDSAQCSFTPAAAPPLWSPCAVELGLAGGLGGSYRVPSPLPRRHADYRFLARGIDDFGRLDPTPGETTHDPVPCVIATGPAPALAALLAGGLPLTVTCSTVHRVRLEVSLAGRRGLVATRTLTDPRARWRAQRTLRLSARGAALLRRRRSARVVVRALALDAGPTRIPATRTLLAGR